MSSFFLCPHTPPLHIHPFSLFLCALGSPQNLPVSPLTCANRNLLSLAQVDLILLHTHICTHLNFEQAPPLSHLLWPLHAPLPATCVPLPTGQQLAGMHSITPHRCLHPVTHARPDALHRASALKQGRPSCFPRSPGSQQHWQAVGVGKRFCSHAQICREGHAVQFVQETIAMFDMS